MSIQTPECTAEDMFTACAGAYSQLTLNGYSSDLRVFQNWSADRGYPWLPADPKTIAAFVDDQVKRRRISTIKRRLCAIAFVHRMCDLPSPTNAMMVRLAVRRAVRQRTSRPQQVLGLTRQIHARIIATCPDTLAGLRDAALISAGYDTLCRSSELAAMLVTHVTFDESESASVIIPRSKSDVSGEGRVAYLSPDTTRRLALWMEASGIRQGPLFRSLHLKRLLEGPLATSSIRRLIKRATQRAGLDARTTAEISGHSMRVGAAQDMMVAGFDALAIMQAGGWKSANVLLRYVENASTRELHERRWELLSRT